jgi:hypothetical protein
MRKGQGLQIAKNRQFQPTFVALLFSSIWDVTHLPPFKAPKYGWWKELDTPAAQLWQSLTKDLSLDYEMSRGFDPNSPKPRILNGDAKSSRASFTATFFYLFSSAGDGRMDVMLLDLLLEQLVDDLETCEEGAKLGVGSETLWLWLAMFGAASIYSATPKDTVEAKQLLGWRVVYEDRIRRASRQIGLRDWVSAKCTMAECMEGVDKDDDRVLEQIWTQAVDAAQQMGVTAASCVNAVEVSDDM